MSRGKMLSGALTEHGRNFDINVGRTALRGPYTINHVAQNCFAQHKFAHSRSSQSAPYTINHVAQQAMLRNMIDRVWARLE
jgi:hypothetical protein